ncbi:N-acetylmuramoyl-L-alanine amidase CwlD [Paenisporosarcina sp. HGH0030]|uniref:N-acetylmuramoyl-L-alanine amidase n=1 Tax=Paenisporosarcina sp. HGH0030 TaxID=1078085 RepID=UPI00034EBBCA|nr:N-acetylmuramoyl-L-alanine amidase [Paenisporosarcina sp. HGH0030]EPD49561.1 N-acetylmuramoyl-L-alanine amidase CwlD [Paenisporosarcina sp. HGH0030]
MKRWIVIGLLLLVSVTVVVYETQASDRAFFLPAPLGGMKIVVDPGHGGMDGGASVGEVVESDITLALGKELEKELKKLGAEVVMTRSHADDAVAEHNPKATFPTIRARKLADLKLREEMIVNSDADLFISVHVNSIPDARWRGAQVFYHRDGHEGGAAIAKAIQGSIREHIGNTDREALAIKQVYLLKKATVPAVLVETGFLSNPEERKLLTSKDYQEQMAEAIADGIEKYVDSQMQ